MALSKKNIKYIKQNINSKSIEEISAKLGVPTREINDFLQNNETTTHIKTSQSSAKTEEFDIMHRLYIVFLGALLAYCPVFCKGNEWYDFANLAQGLYMQGISALFLFLFFARGLINKKLEIIWSWYYIPVFGFLLWAGLSLLWSTNVYEGLYVYLPWLAGGVIFFVLLNSIRDELDIKIIGSLLIMTLLYLTYVGYRQYLDSSFSRYPQVIAPSGTYGNKNMFVDVLQSIIPFGLYLTLIVNKKSLGWNIFGMLLYSLGVTLIILSSTRAGILGSAIQIVLFALCVIAINKFRKEPDRSSKRNLWVQLSILIIVPAIFFTTLEIKNKNIESENIEQTVSLTSVVNRFISIFKPDKQDYWVYEKDIKDQDLRPISDSANMRLVAWPNTFAMFLDKPLTGFGVFNWQIHYADYRKAVYNDPVYRPGMQMIQVHNDYLQLLAELGIPGALLALMIFILNVWAVIRCFRNGTLSNALIALSLGLCFFGLHFVAVFSFPFMKATPTLLFFIYTSFLAYYFNLNAVEKKQKVYQVKPAGALALTVVTFFLLFGVISIVEKMGRADILFKKAYDQNSLGFHSLSIETAKQAFELDPTRKKLHIILGYNYLSVGDLKNAEEEILKGLRYYPNDLQTLLQIGTTYTQLIMQELAKNNRETAEFQRLLDNAEKWFNKALKIREDFHTIYNNWGYVYLLRSQYAKNENPELAKKYADIAIEKFSKSVEINPNYIDGLLNCASLMMQTEKKAEAIKHAEHAANILIDNYKKIEEEFTKVRKVLKPEARKYIMTQNERMHTRQAFLASIGKTLDIILRYYTFHERKPEKHFFVIETQALYHEAKEIELLEKLALAQRELDLTKRHIAKSDAEKHQLASIQKNYDERKSEYETFVENKPTAMLLLTLNKAELYLEQNDEEKAQIFLNEILSFFKQTNISTYSKTNLENLETIQTKAILGLADCLLIKSGISSSGQIEINQKNIAEFNKNSAQIEAYLNQVTNLQNPNIQRYKNLLIEKFRLSKERFKSIILPPKQ